MSPTIQSLLLAPRDRHAGSLLIALGLMSLLKRHYAHVAIYRPVVHSTQDKDLHLLQQVFRLGIAHDKTYGMTLDEAKKLMAQHQTAQIFQKCLQDYQALKAEYDFVLILGMEQRSVFRSLDMDLNLMLAKSLDVPFIPILNGEGQNLTQLQQVLEMEYENLQHAHLKPLSLFINRVSENLLEPLGGLNTPAPLFALPEVPNLSRPTVGQIKDALGAECLFGDISEINRLVHAPIVAAMTAEHYLSRFSEGDLVIVPGDRADILVASILSLHSRGYPNLAGILLTGGLKPSETILKLIEGFDPLNLPVLSVATDTYPTAMAVTQVRGRLSADNPAQISEALGLFDRSVDEALLTKGFEQQRDQRLTPIMFEYGLYAKARANKMRIVLPESDDERVLRAAEILLKRQLVEVILLGSPQVVAHKAGLMGVDLSGAQVMDHKESPWMADFITSLYEMRKHKGMNLDMARDQLNQVTTFATMMVQQGFADGMVSGATHTTADTIRPALQIIKTQAHARLVSSVFFMGFADQVRVFGDCAVNQSPSAQDLADIAIQSALTAQAFGIAPKVALLSYSTGSSGSGEEVTKVRQAAELCHQLRPDLAIEGPLQYDAAMDVEVAKQKLPNSRVAGAATVLIFPDLNTGNNTYKAVQRASGMTAMGPILQGLNKPVNDLSRGCTLEDIVNTVVITAIQAQGV